MLLNLVEQHSLTFSPHLVHISVHRSSLSGSAFYFSINSPYKRNFKRFMAYLATLYTGFLSDVCCNAFNSIFNEILPCVFILDLSRHANKHLNMKAFILRDGENYVS